MAASSERTRVLEVFQGQRADGPCRDSGLQGRPVAVPDPGTSVDRCPLPVPAALQAGSASVHALPLRLRDTELGTLGLLSTTVGALDPDD